MGKQIDLSGCNDPAPVIKLNISDVVIELRVRFSLSCCKLMFQSHDEEGKDYRTSFAGAVFSMYQQKEGETVLTEDDFINTTDENLQLVLDCILEQDQRGKARFEESEIEDVYERFYKAMKDVLHFSIKSPSIQKQIVPQKKVFSLYTSPAFQRAVKAQQATSKWVSYARKISDSPIIKAAKRQQNMFNHNYTYQANQLIQKICQPISDVQNMITPYKAMAERLRLYNEGIAQALQTSLTKVLGETKALEHSIKASLLLRQQKWTEAKETLLEYGWVYSSELPDSFANAIHKHRDELTTAEVNALIVEYFRENRCEKLKKMVNNWTELPYFQCREHVFHEALVNHSRKYFNSSVTLLTLHTEGVITDFVRLNFEKPRFRLDAALNDIKQELSEVIDVKNYDFQVFDDAMKQIEEAFHEQFEPKDPDAASNNSRHKIAHGHVYEPETEVNSLKLFLCLNELYHLLQTINKEEESTS